MPPKFSGNHGPRTVAGRKIKQVWRPKQKPSPPPPWTELPRDITANILHRLGAIEMMESAQKVCTTWRSVCKDPCMWRVIDMSNDGHLSRRPIDLEEMCIHAVNRSQGQLVDINLEYFASDELLDHIASRSKLKRLRLARCDDLSGKGLIAALKRFPELEEFCVTFIYISSESVEMIGRSCPLLRSFTFNKLARLDVENGDALAIARSMPELRHLQLFGNCMTNEGLEAILDGCPHLESLDLRRCRFVKLTADIKKRCSTQIKCMRYPDECPSDYHFNEEEYDSYGYYSESESFDDCFNHDCFDYEDCHINMVNHHHLFDDDTGSDHEDEIFDDNF